MNKLEIEWSPGLEIEKINQIEIKRDHIFINTTIVVPPTYSPKSTIGIDVNVCWKNDVVLERHHLFQPLN